VKRCKTIDESRNKTKGVVAMKSGEDFVDALHAGARTILTLGIVLVILGVVAVLAPWASGLAVQAVVGFVLIAGGITWIVLSFHARSWGSGLWEALVGVMALVCGVIMLAHPLVGLAVMTLALAAYFTAAGILKIVFAFHLRPVRGWGWVLFNGVISILLGVLITYQWPISGTWAVGTLVGVDLLIGGFSLVRTGSASEHALREKVDQ
jgi:uncharacterized membrane protein HdeD (DUF308 family)